MPSKRFFQLIDFISPSADNGLLWETYQTCAPGEIFNYCGREYSNYLLADPNFPAAVTSINSDATAKLVIPWGSSRGLSQLSAELLDSTNFFENHVLRFAILLQDDPGFFVPFVPYVVEFPNITDTAIELTLQNPTNVVFGDLTTLRITDQKFPELNRTTVR